MLNSALFIKEISLKPFDGEADYAADLPIFQKFEPLKITQPLTFFVGENGSGKSTLLEGIALNFGFNSEGGTLNYQFSVRETVSTIWQYLNIGKSGLLPKDSFFLRAESFYNLASYTEDIALDTHEFGGSPLHEQSHGESFFNLVKYRFRGKGLYLLDEPEAALPPQKQLALMVLLNDLIKTGAQFIIATHSPILLAMPEATILAFDEDGIQEVSYQETSAYQVTKMILDNREGMLKQLLED